MVLKEKLESQKNPQKVTFEPEELTDTYGKFTAQPFEKGFAITIGNSLRRAMLSTIPGYAVTSMKIDGVSNEYENIEGVKEDTINIMLALKKLVVKLQDDLEEKVIHIEKSGPGTLTAQDIADADSSLEVFNPELHIATLNEDVQISLDIQIEAGYGYVPSEMSEDLSQEIGAVVMDALFSPVKRVRFDVDDVRIGHRTDYGKLTIEVETNGTIKPEKALSWAAKTLRQNLYAFLTAEEAEEEREIDETEIEESILDKLKDIHIEEAGFSVRTNNFLSNADLKTLDKVVTRSEDELMRIPNATAKIVEEIKEKMLDEYEVELGYKPKAS